MCLVPLCPTLHLGKSKSRLMICDHYAQAFFDLSVPALYAQHGTSYKVLHKRIRYDTVRADQ